MTNDNEYSSKSNDKKKASKSNSKLRSIENAMIEENNETTIDNSPTGRIARLSVLAVEREVNIDDIRARGNWKPESIWHSYKM